MIKIRHPHTGEERLVEEGVPYKRCHFDEGWCWEVGDNVDSGQEFEEATGIKIGDSIAKFTKAFGIEPCSKCEQRRRVLNEIGKRGVKGTLKALKDIGL